jgi:hypothetical protein
MYNVQLLVSRPKRYRQLRHHTSPGLLLHLELTQANQNERNARQEERHPPSHPAVEEEEFFLPLSLPVGLV